MRSLPFALALALLATLASGCMSGTPGATTSQGTSSEPSISDGPTPTEYTCTASPGGVVGGGTGGVEISGCTLVTLARSMKLLAADIPAGCSATYDDNGDNLSDGSIAVGDTYAKGTSISMGCDATNSSGKGTLQMLDA